VHHGGVAVTPDGWETLSGPEEDQIWDRFDAMLKFRPSVNPDHWPSIDEPTPSITWDLAFDLGSDDTQVNTALMAAWQSVLAADDWLYVLDWQHRCYRCWPHRVRPDAMVVNVCPDGDYFIFLSPDLLLGTFGHPWEDSLCVWGGALLDAFGAANERVLNRILRQKGRATPA
jgi:hypothetical protein